MFAWEKCMRRVACVLVFVSALIAIAISSYLLEKSHGARPRQALIVSAAASYITGSVMACLASAFQRRSKHVRPKKGSLIVSAGQESKTKHDDPWGDAW